MNNKSPRQFYFERPLTTEQLRYFDEHGIIQFKGFADKATVASLLEEVNQTQRYLLRKGVCSLPGRDHLADTHGTWPLGRGNNPANAGQSMLEGKFRNTNAGDRDPLFVCNNVR